MKKSKIIIFLKRLYEFVWIALIGFFMAGTLSYSYAGLSEDEKEMLNNNHQKYQDKNLINLSESMSLDEALRYAVLHNANLEKAFYRWKASVHGIATAKSLDDPQLAFKTFFDEVETRVGPQEQMFSISQKFPFPGKLHHQGEAASALSRQRFAEFQKAKLALFYEIKDVYFEYWFLYKKIWVTEENKLLLERFEGVAQSKFKSGLTRNQDLLRAQVELGKLENNLLTFNDYRFPIVARLNAVLNRSISASIGWPRNINHQTLSLEKEKIYKIFYQNNPDLAQAAQRIEEARRRVKLARLDYLPDLTIGFDYIKTDNGPLNVADNGTDATALMFKVNVPLWTKKQKNQLDKARSLETAAIASRVQLERDLESKISMIYFKVKDAHRQIELYQNALIPKAEQSLKASETAYSAGEVDFLYLIDSERTLLSFQLSYYLAIRNYEQRLAELEMIIGEKLRGEKK